MRTIADIIRDIEEIKADIQRTASVSNRHAFDLGWLESELESAITREALERGEDGA